VANIVLLNNEQHRDIRVCADASVELGDGQRFVPIVLNEIPYLVAHYPLLFSKDAETGAFYLGAVLGFDEGENLFLEEDCYRPLQLRRMPFFTAGEQVAIDLEHKRVGHPKGAALFNDQGEPTAYLAGVVGILRELRSGETATKDFIARLMQLKLIEALTVTLGFDDGPRELVGLYTINKDHLAALEDAQVVELFRNGDLQAIHSLIASMRHIATMANRKNRRLTNGTGAV
jgi:hypothetical protein